MSRPAINLPANVRDACLDAGAQALVAAGIPADQVPTPRWIAAVILTAVVPYIQAGGWMPPPPPFETPDAVRS